MAFENSISISRPILVYWEENDAENVIKSLFILKLKSEKEKNLESSNQIEALKEAAQKANSK